jgi:hypothetical protein
MKTGSNRSTLKLGTGGVVSFAVDAYGGLDVAVNKAGIGGEQNSTE